MAGIKSSEHMKLLAETILLKSRVELLEARLDDALAERDKARIELMDERRFWRNEMDKLVEAAGPKAPPSELSDLVDTQEEKDQAQMAQDFSKKWHADHAFWHETSGFTITEGKNG